MTQLLHDRAEQLWSPLRVPGRALVETCPVSAPWRDLSLEGAAAEDQTRGPRAEASAVKQVPLSSLQSRPAECGCEPAVPEPATQVWIQSETMGDMARPLQTVCCEQRRNRRSPSACPSHTRPGRLALPVPLHPCPGVKSAGPFVTDGQVKNFRRKKKSLFHEMTAGTAKTDTTRAIEGGKWEKYSAQDGVDTRWRTYMITTATLEERGVGINSRGKY